MAIMSKKAAWLTGISLVVVALGGFLLGAWVVWSSYLFKAPVNQRIVDARHWNQVHELIEQGKLTQAREQTLDYGLQSLQGVSFALNLTPSGKSAISVVSPTELSVLSCEIINKGRQSDAPRIADYARVVHEMLQLDEIVVLCEPAQADAKIAGR